MKPVTIYHNPRCSKSRQVMALLESGGAVTNVVEYLKQPPDYAELDKILKMLDLEPRALMRTHEHAYRENRLDDPALTREDLISAMIANPVLIERPIVISGERAIIGRPPEKVLELV